jgi:hypothetical protein
MLHEGDNHDITCGGAKSRTLLFLRTENWVAVCFDNKLPTGSAMKAHIPETDKYLSN